MAHILFIEDEPWMGELYVQVLGRDHDVVWLRDGYEAIDAIDRYHPDVILLDVMLPWVSGIQLLHELASYRDTANIPVVLFSAALPDNISEDVLRTYGVVATINKSTTKPVDVQHTINQVVNDYAKHTN